METLRNVWLNIPQTQIRVTSVTSTSKESTLDLDAHADTCVLCANVLVIKDHDRPVNVLAYDPALGDHTYQTASCVIGYDHPITVQTYHLVIHQAIIIPHLEHHLLCPMHKTLAITSTVTVHVTGRQITSTLSVQVTGRHNHCQYLIETNISNIDFFLIYWSNYRQLYEVYQTHNLSSWAVRYRCVYR